MKKSKKIMLLIIAFITLGLGTTGIFLPVLPTVPLYLLSALCFANSSEKLHDWFINSNLYKKHALPYIKAGGHNIKNKNNYNTRSKYTNTFSGISNKKNNSSINNNRFIIFRFLN